MILRQSANAAVHLAGGVAVGLLLAGLAASMRAGRRRDDTPPEPPAA